MNNQQTISRLSEWLNDAINEMKKNVPDDKGWEMIFNFSNDDERIPKSVAKVLWKGDDLVVGMFWKERPLKWNIITDFIYIHRDNHSIETIARELTFEHNTWKNNMKVSMKDE